MGTFQSESSGKCSHSIHFAFILNCCLSLLLETLSLRRLRLFCPEDWSLSSFSFLNLLSIKLEMCLHSFVPPILFYISLDSLRFPSYSKLSKTTISKEPHKQRAANPLESMQSCLQEERDFHVILVHWLSSIFLTEQQNNFLESLTLRQGQKKLVRLWDSGVTVPAELSRADHGWWNAPLCKEDFKSHETFLLLLQKLIKFQRL